MTLYIDRNVGMFGGTSSLRYRYTDMMRLHLEEFDKVKQVRNVQMTLTSFSAESNRFPHNDR